jgi:hypothetical protein
VAKAKASVEAVQGTENKSAATKPVNERAKPFIKRNSKWSYPDRTFWIENSIVAMVTGIFRRKESAIHRRYRLIFHKAVGSGTCFISSEYMNEKDERQVATFGSAEFGYRDCNRKEFEANPNERLVQQQDFVYVHLNKGNIFMSHSTPLVTIDPLNSIVAGFCEAWVHQKMDHPKVVDHIRKFNPESFMKDETRAKISKLMEAHNNKHGVAVEDGSLKTALAVVDVKEHQLTVEDMYDAELAFQRFDMFKEHISETQPTDYYMQFRDEAESRFEIAKKLS